MAARFGAELEATTNDVVPVALGEMVEVVATDALLDEPVEDAGIEVVARTNSAHGGEGGNGVVLGEGGTVQLHTLRTATIDEAGTIEGNLITIHLVASDKVVEHFKIFVRATHYVGILKVLNDGAHELDGLVSMVATEVHIVVDDGTCTACCIKQCRYLVARVGVQRIVGAEENDVVAPNGGTFPIGAWRKGVLIEGVSSIVMLVKKRMYSFFAF